MPIPFDTNAQQTMVRDTIKTIRAQRNGFLHDTGLKTGDPHKEPPSFPPVNPNPRKHDVVAWRHDGLRLDTTRHDTKEAAIDYGRALSWVTYYAYAILCGRDIIERHTISIPDGMALDDNGMPVRLDGWTRQGDQWENTAR